MPMMTQLGVVAVGEPPEDLAARRAAAEALLAEHLEAKRRLERTERHLIVASWNAGLQLKRIAEAIDVSRTPVRAVLRDADARGELIRRLGTMDVYDGLTDDVDAGGLPTVEQG